MRPCTVEPLALPGSPGETLLGLHRRHPHAYPVLLESAAHGTPQGRYSLLLGAPGGRLTIDAGSHCSGPGTGAGFLQRLNEWWSVTGAPAQPGRWPFRGGWFLLLGYELAGEVEPTLRLPPPPPGQGSVAWRMQGAVMHDHATGETVVVDVTTEAWREVLDINLTACFVLAREAARHMVARGAGRIINVGSVMSAVARWGAPAYVSTKHGLAGLTRAVAVEFGHKGVTCNMIAPGFFRTELNRSQQQNPKVSEQVKTRTPLRRWAEPQELAGAAVFLASDASSYVNGLMLYVDGGLTAAF